MRQVGILISYADSKTHEFVANGHQYTPLRGRKYTAQPVYASTECKRKWLPLLDKVVIWTFAAMICIIVFAAAFVKG